VSLVFLMSELSPYHVACLNALQRQWNGRIVALEAFGKGSHSYDDSKYDLAQFEVHTACKTAAEASTFREIPFLHSHLLAVRPKYLLLSGWRYPWFFYAAALGRALGSQMMAMSDTRWEDRRRWPLKEFMKRATLPLLVPSIFVPGERAADYARTLGYREERVHQGLYAIDTGYYAREAAAARAERDYWRQRLSLPQNFFLFSGRFSPEKNISGLLEAYIRYHEKVSEPWSLVMLGDGPLRSEVVAGGIPGVIAPGFVQLDLVPRYLGLASVFVLASHMDPWPLVVLEAAAAGLPLLVSENCGVSVELVGDDDGWVFEPSDIEHLASLMEEIATGVFDLKRMGACSAGRAKRYDAGQWAETVISWMEHFA